MRRAAAGFVLALASSLAAAADEDLGRKVFTQSAQPPCALCHALSAAGAAGTIGPSLDELKPDRDKVAQAVRKGVGVMPPYGDKLTPEQIEAVVTYVVKATGAK